MADLDGEFAANGVRFQSVKLSFTLPADAVLDAKRGFKTRGATRVVLTLDKRKSKLEIMFTPGLLVPSGVFLVRNATFERLTYRFATSPTSSGILTVAAADAVSLGLVRCDDDFRSAITAWFNDMTKGTRLASPGYNPLHDADVMGLLNQLRASLATPGSSAEMPNLTGLDGELKIRTLGEIRMVSGDNAFEIPSGSDVTLDLQLSGTAADVHAGTITVSSLDVYSDSIFVQDHGERFARITWLRVLNGCEVKVETFELVSEQVADEVKTMNKVENSGTFFDLMLSRGGSMFGGGNLKGADNKRVVQYLLEKGLANALRELYTKNYASMRAKLSPGISLDRFFGETCRHAP
jgi:hypothetical protein